MANDIEFSHRPVLLDEVIALVQAAQPRVIVDGTLGGAGHSTAMLEAAPDAKLIGFDRDTDALHAATQRLAKFKDRVTLIHAPFSRMRQELEQRGVEHVDATLVDLGVSSHQLDTKERGFSFRMDAPLDMRMDTTQGTTAAQLIDELEADDLADVIFQLGEERHSRKIARAIKMDRPQTTGALASLIARIIPNKPNSIHPATRTFQALRMKVNDELGELDAHLHQLGDLLSDDGIGMVITFHSLEDRAVKHYFRDHGAKRRAVNKYAKEYMADVDPNHVFTELADMAPTDNEVQSNPRSRSARLRAVKRLPRHA